MRDEVAVNMAANDEALRIFDKSLAALKKANLTDMEVLIFCAGITLDYFEQCQGKGPIDLSQTIEDIETLYMTLANVKAEGITAKEAQA